MLKIKNLHENSTVEAVKRGGVRSVRTFNGSVRREIVKRFLTSRA